MSISALIIHAAEDPTVIAAHAITTNTIISMHLDGICIFDHAYSRRGISRKVVPFPSADPSSRHSARLSDTKIELGAYCPSSRDTDRCSVCNVYFCMIFTETYFS